jgi:hypothetical protein
MDVVRTEAFCQSPSSESHIGVHDHEFGYIRNIQGTARKRREGRAMLSPAGGEFLGPLARDAS